VNITSSGALVEKSLELSTQMAAAIYFLKLKRSDGIQTVFKGGNEAADNLRLTHEQCNLGRTRK
jgi:hypothetical protein